MHGKVYSARSNQAYSIYKTRMYTLWRYKSTPIRGKVALDDTTLWTRLYKVGSAKVPIYAG